jgi:hypothetical protein
MTAQSGMSLSEGRRDPEFWGRVVESAVGAHLANAAAADECEVFYWRERNREVDFVTRVRKIVTTVEFKSGRSPDALPGLAAFRCGLSQGRKLLVGGDGIRIAEFLGRPVGHWLSDARE